MTKKIAVVGATGTLGREILNELAARGIDRADVAALASERSIGVSISYGEESEIKTDDLAAFDFAHVSAPLRGRIALNPARIAVFRTRYTACRSRRFHEGMARRTSR